MMQCLGGFLRILSTEFASCSSHQGEIIIVKRLIQGHNNVTRVRVKLFVEYLCNCTFKLRKKFQKFIF